MPSREDVENSTAHMVAVLCMQLVREDPELIRRLQELGRKTGVPFDAGKLDEKALEMAEAGVTVVGQQLVRRRGAIRAFELPIPQIGPGSTAHAAGALAVGSFTTEYVHSVPGRVDAFASWMREHYPAVTDELNIGQDTIEDADSMLTLMAHVAGRIADVEGETDDKQGDAGDRASDA